MATKKLVKLALLAGGAYVVAFWVLGLAKSPATDQGTGAGAAAPNPPAAPAPPQYPTDPMFCYEHPDDPLCAGFVGI